MLAQISAQGGSSVPGETLSNYKASKNQPKLLIVGVRAVKDTRRRPPTGSTKQGSQGLTETEAAIVEPAWICAGSSAYVMLEFYGTSESRACLRPFACTWEPIPPTELPCPALIGGFVAGLFTSR